MPPDSTHNCAAIAIGIVVLERNITGIQPAAILDMDSPTATSHISTRQGDFAQRQCCHPSDIKMTKATDSRSK